MTDRSVSRHSYITELDGIRGIAILMVLIWHYVDCQGGGTIDSSLGLFARGTYLFWSGVDLFFVLSGFLIGGILLDNYHADGCLRTFYVRRATRILPVYFLLLAAYFVARALLNHQRYDWLFDDVIPDAAYLTFTQNFFMGQHNTCGGFFLGVTWSLAVEEQFYLALPALLMIAGVSRFKQLIIVLAVSAPFLRLAVPGFHAVVETPFRMDSLLAGVLLAVVMRSATAVDLLYRGKSALWGTFCVLLGGMFLMTIRGAGREFLEPSIIALFYTVFVMLAVLYRETRLTSLLRSRFLTQMGVYSYGLYMYHQVIAGLLHGYLLGAHPRVVTMRGAVITLVSLVLTVCTAIISHHTIESYFRSLGRRLSYDGKVQ